MYLSIYIQLNQNCNNQCGTSSDKCIMTVIKGKNRRSNFFNKSGSRFWWTMIQNFHFRWLQVIFNHQKNFSSIITKIKIFIFEKLPEASHNYSHDHDILFGKLFETSHNHSHDHDNDNDRSSQPESWSWRAKI